jgi:hypothetical protein
MTTSGSQENPAGRHAIAAEPPPRTELSPRAAATGDTPQAARQSGVKASAPADAQQLQREIERTREQLGETIDELVARVDVRSRARAKAAEVSGQVKSKTGQTWQDIAARAGNLRRQIAGKTATARHRAIPASGTGKDQLRGQLAAASASVRQATPERVRQAASKGVSGAREHWIPLAVAAGALTVGYLAIRQYRRR